MEEKKKRGFRWQEPLIAFGVTCVLQALVIALTVWYQDTQLRGQIIWEWNTAEIWIGNAIAFVIMFFIIYHFIKKPKEKANKKQQEKW